MVRRPMAQSDFTDLRNALAHALRPSASQGRGVVLAPLWREVVGGLADYSHPTELVDGVLRVEASPDFCFDLDRSKESIRKRLEQRLGKGSVRRIELWTRR
jgi:hypothetical protein